MQMQLADERENWTAQLQAHCKLIDKSHSSETETQINCTPLNMSKLVRVEVESVRWVKYCKLQHLNLYTAIQMKHEPYISCSCCCRCMILFAPEVEKQLF